MAMYSARDTSKTSFTQWPTPNYDNPERRTWMPGFLLAWQIVSTVLVGGRFYLRGRKQAGSFGFDDLLIFFGWLWSLGLSINTWYGVAHFGLDRHSWDVKPEWAEGAALAGWIAQIFFVASTVCTKISVLLFHRRMINLTIDRAWLWAIRAALAFTTAYGGGVMLAYCFYCRPLDSLWLKYTGTYTKDYKCIDGDQIAVVAGALSVVSDLLAVALPCLMLNHYDLDVPRRQKIALNATFAISLLATGAGIARSYYLWEILHTNDSTWVGYDLFVWSVVECHLAIICACAPSLRVFFRRHLIDTLRRSLSSVSHYARGSREVKDAAADFFSTNATWTNRDSRGFCELKEIESGVHGITQPPPVILGDDRSSHRRSEQDHPPSPRYVETSTGKIVEKRSRRMRRDTQREPHNGAPTPPPTPPITTADEYESYAMERLSRHGTICREKSFTGLSQRASHSASARLSHTASILNRFDDFVEHSRQSSRNIPENAEM